MEKFMLIFHGPQTDEEAFQEMSPDEFQAVIEKWNTWIGGIEAQGKMLGTDALLPAGKVLSNKGQTVTDGPFTEGKEIVGGYLLLNAESFEEALTLAQGCPHFDTGGKVEVRQVQQF
ncbi:YciI family protein [Larkinella harenae]